MSVDKVNVCRNCDTGRQFAEIPASEIKITTDKLLGRGSSSNVYPGQYGNEPVALKRIKFKPEAPPDFGVEDLALLKYDIILYLKSQKVTFSPKHYQVLWLYHVR